MTAEVRGDGPPGRLKDAVPGAGCSRRIGWRRRAHRVPCTSKEDRVPDDERVTYRTCPLCEATCGLEVTSRGEEILRIRGDRDDVFSAGFICPKGSALRQLDSDPDRVRTPRIRGAGGFRDATWDEAFALIEERLVPIIRGDGPNAVALYLGNPNVHNMAGVLYNRVLARALGSRNVFSAATVDQMPKHVSSGLMFGHPDLIPVPDIDPRPSKKASISTTSPL